MEDSWQGMLRKVIKRSDEELFGLESVLPSWQNFHLFELVSTSKVC